MKGYPSGSLDRYRGYKVYEKRPYSHDVYLHTNLFGNGTVAYETHGSRGGKLMNREGKMQPAYLVAMIDIQPLLLRFSTNLPPGKPIILIACWSGISGAASQVAKVLGRPVYGFQRQVVDYGPSVMCQPSVFLEEKNETMLASQYLTHERDNKLWRLYNRIRNKPNVIFAPMSLYMPSGR